MIDLNKIALTLVKQSKKEKKPKCYRYVEAINEEKEIYIGVSVELLSKEAFEIELSDAKSDELLCLLPRVRF